jgi:hypothetical protein
VEGGNGIVQLCIDYTRYTTVHHWEQESMIVQNWVSSPIVSSEIDVLIFGVDPEIFIELLGRYQSLVQKPLT